MSTRSTGSITTWARRRRKHPLLPICQPDLRAVWDRRYVSSVRITVAEAWAWAIGRYYDHAGVLRYVPNPPPARAPSPWGTASFNADAVRNEGKGVGAIGRCCLRTCARPMRGYCETADVAPRSQTATFAAIKLYVDTWRWQGVPFFLRSGKALAEQRGEPEFQCPPRLLPVMRP